MRIKITLVEQKGTSPCHRGHKVGDVFDFDTERGTSLMVQWLQLYAPNAGDPDSILGQETGSCMPQPRPGTAKVNK